MPAVQPPAKVLVSGANGFVAIWVVKTLLEKGYAVRGTVRSLEKGDHLKTLFGKYGDKFELAVVENIEKEGAFDEAVKDVDAIEHTASPYHYNVDDPQEIIGPAVNGTVSILKSALKYGERVKRIVITSSVVSVLDVSLPPHPGVYTEADWNENSIIEIKEKGKDSSSMAKYSASKTLAERAAWDFYEKEKSSINWELVVLNPPYVYGPVLHSVSSPKHLNTSVIDWYYTVAMRSASTEKPGGGYIDVRDLAELHVLSLSTEKAGGERFLVSAGTYTWQDWLNVADGVKNVIRASVIDVSKAYKVFEFKYRSMGETATDMLDDFKTKGWTK